jgi:hypothetical protein
MRFVALGRVYLQVCQHHYTTFIILLLPKAHVHEAMELFQIFESITLTFRVQMFSFLYGQILCLSDEIVGLN